MFLRAAVALALAAVLVPSTASACSGTLSGALTGSFECTVAVTAGQSGQFSIVMAPSGKIDGVERFLPATFEFSGRPAVGILTLATLSGARASLQTTGKATYRAGLAAGKRQGEVTLTLETVEREARGGFTVSGTLHARLTPVSGKGAPVVVDVAF
jgi:hypothetical protein